MKIKDIIQMQSALASLMAKKMPVKLSYAIAKNLKMINREMEDFEEARVKLLREHWALDPKTNKYNIPDEDKPKWDEMYKELIEMEMGFQPYLFPYVYLEGLEFTPGEMLALENFYQEEKQPA